MASDISDTSDIVRSTWKGANFSFTAPLCVLIFALLMTSTLYIKKCAILVYAKDICYSQLYVLWTDSPIKAIKTNLMVG